MTQAPTQHEPHLFITLAESIVKDLCECPVCHRESIGQDCLREHIRQAVEQKRSDLPTDMIAALGFLDDVDLYRQHGRNIPEEHIDPTLSALHVIEKASNRKRARRRKASTK